ncbi:MAG: hypothetical protein JW915_06330 [Chitinispirillaceae bacterium]|nr:hypothetical protein [Chitinispirillaceae bacterium]
MIVVIVIAVIFLALMLVALRVAITKPNHSEDDVHNPLIHASGIYSIVRKSPRDAVYEVKPDVEEIRKYLSNLNENINKFSPDAVENVINNWNKSLENSIKAVEDGDRQNVEFYYFDFEPVDCPICSNYLKKGQFVTREEIFNHPNLLPPFHLGCTATLLPHHGKEDLRETTELGMMPLFKRGKCPELPDWKSIPKQTTIRGSR